tara:strand:- start:4341 stop:4565 length:225 start_codon:yes stop_codon:yes gene_type:complete
MDEDKSFIKAHMDAHKLMQDLVANGVNPMAVAGIFQAIATQMYRTMLDDDEFVALMASVIDTSKDTKQEEKVYH